MSPRFPDVLPLAALTVLGLLSIDLLLPALPLLPAELNGSVADAQAVVALFLVSLALSQLVWGLFADRAGPRRALLLGLSLQVLGGVACALAPSWPVLWLGRVVQGFGAGAATVVVPMLVRRRYAPDAALQVFAWVGVVESMVPALAPLLGAALLLVTTWRGTFTVVVVAAVALWAWVVARAPREQSDPSPPRPFRPMEHREALLNGLSYALGFAGLLGFVASAPHLVQSEFGLGPAWFGGLQCVGVLGFASCASQVGRWKERGVPVLPLGTALVLLATGLLVVHGASSVRHFGAMAATWFVFGCGFGLRQPLLFTRALQVPAEFSGRATGLLMFLTLGGAGVAIQLMSFALRAGLFGVAVGTMVLVTISSVLPSGTSASAAPEGEPVGDR